MGVLENYIKQQNKAGKIKVQNPFKWKDNYRDGVLEFLKENCTEEFRKSVVELPDKIDRAECFEQFGKDLYAGFVAAMLWGGINASRPQKGHKGDLKTTDACRAFSEEAKTITKKLSDVKMLLRESTIAKAYDSMKNGENRIPGVGRSFLTKILFFLSGESGYPSPRPLIFDNQSVYIHRALLMELGDGNHDKWYTPKGSFRKSEVGTYGNYLEVMDAIAKKCDIKDVCLLESFLFGKPLNQKGARNNDNPRHVIHNYVNSRTPKKAKGKNSSNTKQEAKSLKVKAANLKARDIKPGEGRKISLKGKAFPYEGVETFWFIGEDKRKIFCELLNSNASYPIENVLSKKQFDKRGGEAPYWIMDFKKHDRAAVESLYNEVWKILKEALEL